MSGVLTQLGLGGAARVSSLAGDMSGWTSSLFPGGPCVSTASGAMSSGVWKNVLSITGSGGALRMLGARSTSTVNKTLRFRMTRDGVQIYDKTSLSVAAVSSMVAYGCVYGSSNFLMGDGSDLLFDSSFLIEAMYVSGSTPTETDGFNFYVNYDLRG